MSRSDGGHLDYYKEFGISPVRYDLSDLGAHFDRRSSLYNQLGLPEIAFRGCRVLEVAPGSGHNSLYLAQSCPTFLDLVEPNPAGIKDILETYKKYNLQRTEPVLHKKKLQEFEPTSLYDVVICENWLGALPEERQLIKKLATFVTPGGVMVMTIVPLSGFMPNILRKLMANRIISGDMNFEAKTELLVRAFGPHLSTIKGMTRSHVDWVRDCMINPHYLNVALPLDVVLKDVGAKMELLGSSPSFNTDWRWFKSLSGDAWKFNENFYSNYVSHSHNFVDYRYLYPARTATKNEHIDGLCNQLHDAALKMERHLCEGHSWAQANPSQVLKLVEEIAKELLEISPHFSDALTEAGEALAADSLDVTNIANQKYFNALFGRETVYVSFTRRKDPV